MKAVWSIEMIRGRAGAVRSTFPRLLELSLIALLIVQVARLMWIMVTPLSPFGEWRGRHAEIMSADMRASLFRSFDAFYPSPVAASAAQNVTSLALILYGVRVNEGSGLGSAIVAGADGVQGSYAIGDEIQPGVVLKAVMFDHVVIDRGGVEESIFLDQSEPVTSAATQGDEALASAADSGQGTKNALTADAIKAGIGFGPRIVKGRITGLVVAEKGPAFAAAGLRGGDVIVQVNGRPISSADDMGVLQQTLAPGAKINLMVERGADVVPISVTVQQ